MIISGEDSTAPVVAYSLEGSFDEASLPDNARWWMSLVDAQIRAARASGSPRDAAWDRPLTYGPVEYSIPTASWDQEAPHNAKCPTVTVSGRTRTCLSGCVATAAAIVCRFHQWPEVGKGIIPAYSYDDDNNVRRTVPEHTPSSYDFSLMPLTYTSSATSAQKNAVAAFMYDLGTAFKMQYGYTSGSSAYTQVALAALMEHFGYSRQAIVCNRDSYSDEKWVGMLRDELASIGPIMYGGQGSDGGHQFVLDGCTEDDYFHVNWGWGGHGNGYFRISAMKYDGHSFSEYHDAVFGLVPDKKGTSQRYDQLILTPDGQYKGLTSTTKSFTRGVQFNVRMGYLYNNAPDPFNGNVTVALYDAEGHWKEHVSEAITLSLYKNYYIAHVDGDKTGQYCKGWPSVPCTINSTIRGGDRLRVHFVGHNSSGYAMVDDSSAKYEIVVCNRTPEQVAAATSISCERRSRSICITSEYDLRCTLASSETGEVVFKGSSEAGETITISRVGIAPGDYQLSLYSGDEPFQMTLKL